jgi:hypothetical protein
VYSSFWLNVFLYICFDNLIESQKDENFDKEWKNGNKQFNTGVKKAR